MDVGARAWVSAAEVGGAWDQWCFALGRVAAGEEADLVAAHVAVWNRMELQAGTKTSRTVRLFALLWKF